jgi:hypothetical protein
LGSRIVQPRFVFDEVKCDSPGSDARGFPGTPDEILAVVSGKAVIDGRQPTAEGRRRLRRGKQIIRAGVCGLGLDTLGFDETGHKIDEWICHRLVCRNRAIALSINGFAFCLLVPS